MFEVGSSRGSTARFRVQQFIAKSLQMCGKGHRVLLQRFGRKQRCGPKPFPHLAATELISSTQKLPQNIPAKPPQMWQKYFPKTDMGGWEGGCFPCRQKLCSSLTARLHRHAGAGITVGLQSSLGRVPSSDTSELLAAVFASLALSFPCAWSGAGTGPMHKISGHMVIYRCTSSWGVRAEPLIPKPL